MEVKKVMAALADWESVDDSTLLKLVQQLQKNSESIDEKFNPLIQQILLGNWYLRSDGVIRQVERFISELIVLRPAFAGTAIFSFVSKFCLSDKNISTNSVSVDSISPTEQKVFGICHRNLKRIFASFPKKEENGVKSLSHAYPYMGKSPHIHYCYVHNLLRCIDYLPQGRGQIIQVLIHKLARIDVNIPRDDIVAACSSSPGSDDDIFDMNLDSEVPPNPLIDTLDLCLNMLFDYVDRASRRVKTEEEEDDGRWWDSEAGWDQFTDWMLDTFETEILPSFGLNNVPFLYFYLCSLHPPFLSRFMDFLWTKGTNVNTSHVIRIQAMAYLSGILARATFVSIKVVKSWLTRMCDWSNHYASQRSKTVHWSCVNVQMHGPFYAVCQAVLYVFAFRNKDLITSRKCGAFTRSLDLGRLLTCELNPLKACQKEIALTFVDAAHHHQISYCGTVMERNAVVKIPTVSQTSVQSQSAEPLASAQLEAFFPFDPLLLPRCREWVQGIHLAYEPYEGEGPSTRRLKAPVDEDSIEMELGSFSEYDRSGRSLRSQLKQSVDMGLMD